MESGAVVEDVSLIEQDDVLYLQRVPPRNHFPPYDGFFMPKTYHYENFNHQFYPNHMMQEFNPYNLGGITRMNSYSEIPKYREENFKCQSEPLPQPYKSEGVYDPFPSNLENIKTDCNKIEEKYEPNDFSDFKTVASFEEVRTKLKNQEAMK